MKTHLTTFGRSLITVVCLCSLCVTSLGLTSERAFAAGAPVGQAANPLQACGAVAEADLRAELNTVSQQSFAGDHSPIDIGAIVASQWVALNVDGVIDGEVNQAVDQVRNDESLWSQFLSGWSPSKAEVLTHKVAALTFGSAVFRAKIDALSTAIAADVARQIATLSAESASQATLCLQQYIGQKYSGTILAAFTKEIRSDTGAIDYSVGEDLNTGILSVIDRHKAALGGVGVIIASQVAKRIVQRITVTISERVESEVAVRVLGETGASVIPAVGWTVGIGLIVYDLIQSREGALPQIRTSLQSEEVKNTIRNEIIASVEPDLRVQMPQIARGIANDLYAEWLDFQRKYREVLDLAGTNPQFRAQIAQVDDLGKLATLVDVGLAALGRDGLNATVADGSFARALSLPEQAFDILRTEKSMHAVVDWADLAGAHIDDVVRLQIYKHKTPADLTRDQLLALLALDDEPVIAKLILLEPKALNQLLGLSGDTLKGLAAQLSADDLKWLAAYLATLDKGQADQLVVNLTRDPGLMASLKDDSVRVQLVNSPNVDAALTFLSTPVDPLSLMDNLTRLVTGAVSLRLFVHKYGMWVTVVTTVVTILLLLALAYTLLKWLFAPLAGLYRLAAALFTRPAHSGQR